MAMVDTTSGPLIRRSIQLAGPAVLQAVLVNFYAFNDFFFVGLTSDEASTAALSACFALVIVANTLIGIFPMGAMTLMSQSFGAKRPDRVASLLRNVLVVASVWAIVVGGLGLVFMDPIVAATNVTAAVADRLSSYMSVLFGALVMFALMRSVSAAFYSCGDTKTPLALEFASLIVNTLLNYVLVLGFGPIPAMGITGAAIATVFARALPGLAGLYKISKGGLGFALTDAESTWKPAWRDTRTMARIGFFESLSGLLYGVIYLMLNRIAGQIGPAAQGGLGAGLRGIEWIAFAFGDGFLTASAAIVGQNIGAGKFERAMKGAWLNAGLSAACCQAVSLLFLFFPEQLCSLVTDDPATLDYASRYVSVIGWVMWAVGLEMSMYGALIGAGWTQMCVWVSGVANILRVPIAAAFVFGAGSMLQGTLWAYFGKGTAPAVTGGFDGLSYAIAITAVIKAVIYMAFFATRRQGIQVTHDV